jgi:hypothetical protein
MHKGHGGIECSENQQTNMMYMVVEITGLPPNASSNPFAETMKMFVGKKETSQSWH